MNLDNLKTFYIIAKANSISKAAKQLHATQPGLSAQLKNLENDLGVQLLNRSNRGVDLTEEGKIVFDHTEKIINIEADIKKKLKIFKEQQQDLHLASCSCFGEYILPSLIYSFKQEYEGMEIFLDIQDNNDVIEELVNYKTNLGIYMGEYEGDEEIVSYPIYKDRFVLVTSNNVEFDHEIDCETLSQLEMIMPKEDSYYYKMIMNILSLCLIDFEDVNVAVRLNSFSLIKTAIMKDYGIAILPKTVVKDELERGMLKAYDISHMDTSFNYYLAHMPDYQLTEMDKELVDFVVDYMSKSKSEELSNL